MLFIKCASKILDGRMFILPFLKILTIYIQLMNQQKESPQHNKDKLI